MADLAGLVAPGVTVAVSDGAGMPTGVLGALSAAARAAGDVRLFLGWCVMPPDGLDPAAFADVRTLMGGYGLRRLIDDGEIRYLPVRLGAAPALIGDVIRPDVLVASVVRRPDGFHLATEVSWLRAALASGATVAAVERPALSCADAGPPLPPERMVVVDGDEATAAEVAWGEPDDVHREIAERVTALVPAGARLQYGPGSLGTAVLDALAVPAAVDTGIVTGAVVGLDRRGLLAEPPVATYVAGGGDLYQWVDGRPLLHPVEFTHDPARLAAGRPLVAVNTALEIDLDGQVNVEAVGGSAVAGIGGQPDYAFAAARSVGGASIVALPTARSGRSTLVETLSAPVSTPSHDVDVVATERGVADLRGLDRRERRRALERLYDQ